MAAEVLAVEVPFSLILTAFVGLLLAAVGWFLRLTFTQIQAGMNELFTRMRSTETNQATTTECVRHLEASVERLSKRLEARDRLHQQRQHPNQ
ncbi:hypothetical protein JN531_012710 [Flagellatimonas centrodinii]|uniref:hypothetical protein n=1 Tax=Flagellatimonas centrodinii TaxID=2806210 RepID=UPI001FEF3843|nr:hypothetical protein [Flagellatimonas centrodinii]ULQ45961.1 hypothetical protein JN531_012710 [Flagellatimonas centrodinii]